MTVKREQTPWFILLSRICRALCFLFGLLLILHLGRFSDIRSGLYALQVTSLLRSGWWGDRAIVVIALMLGAAGLELCLTDKKLFKTFCLAAILTFVATVVLSGIATAVTHGGPRTLFDRMMEVIATASPLLIAGVLGAAYEIRQGPAALEKWRLAREQRERLLARATSFRPPDTPKTKQKRKFDDFLPYLMLTIFGISLTIVGLNAVKHGESAFWPFFLFGGLLVVTVLYTYALISAWKMTWDILWSRATLAALAVGFVMAVMGMQHALTPAHWLRSATIEGLTASRYWPDQVLPAALALAMLLGVHLSLCRWRLREYLLLTLPLGILLPFVFRFAAADGRCAAWLRDLMSIAWPLSVAVLAAVYGFRYHAESIAWSNAKRLEVQEKEAEKARLAQQAQQAKQAQLTRQLQQPRRDLAPKPAPTPAADLAIEARLKQLKADYERKRQESARQAARQRWNNPAAELLPKAAERAFPGGSTLATLNGQRQLMIRLTEGVPCLAPLRQRESARRLMAPDLADDPEAFLPILSELTAEATALLRERVWDDVRNWHTLSPEALAGGWFALRMYARMSNEDDIYLLTADAIAESMSHRQDAMAWLKSQGGEEDGLLPD